MPYTPTVWVSGVTPADAAALNNLETQYDEAVAEDLLFSELVGGGSHNTAGFGAWEDWDLSAIVPAGTAAVLVKMYHFVTGDAFSTKGARNNGSGLSRLIEPLDKSTQFLLTPCDGSRIIEIYDNGDGGVPGITTNFTIFGYWKPA